MNNWMELENRMREKDREAQRIARNGQIRAETAAARQTLRGKKRSWAWGTAAAAFGSLLAVAVIKWM